MIEDLERVRTRLTALKEQIATTNYYEYDWFYSADEWIYPLSYADDYPTVGDIEDRYDPVRRIEAIERILYG